MQHHIRGTAVTQTFGCFHGQKTSDEGLEVFADAKGGRPMDLGTGDFLEG